MENDFATKEDVMTIMSTFCQPITQHMFHNHGHVNISAHHDILFRNILLRCLNNNVPQLTQRNREMLVDQIMFCLSESGEDWKRTVHLDSDDDLCYALEQIQSTLYCPNKKVKQD